MSIDLSPATIAALLDLLNLLHALSSRLGELGALAFHPKERVRSFYLAIDTYYLGTKHKLYIRVVGVGQMAIDVRSKRHWRWGVIACFGNTQRTDRSNKWIE